MRAGRTATIIRPPLLCSFNSVGRVPSLQVGSRRFEPVKEHHMGNQLIFGRASALQAEGDGFESHILHHLGLEADGKAATRNSKVGSTPTGSTNRGLTHGFKARLNYHRSVQISKLDSYQPSSRHGVCGLVVKDLVKINDSKVNLPPLFYIKVAQLAEQRIHIPQVVGSIPTFDTIAP